MIRVKKKDGTLISEKILNCDTFFKRLRGLMFRRSLDGFDGILLSPCDSIHSFFMRMDIDCYFLDADKRVVRVMEKFSPGRLSGFVKNGRYVLELPAGKLPSGSIAEGDMLEIEY